MSPDPIADELAIRHLAAAYTDAVNRDEPFVAAATYAPDGSLTMMERRPVEGRDAVGQFLIATFSRYDLVAQLTHSGIVEVDGDSARARWQVTEMQCPKDDGPRFIIGRYEDSLVRLDEGWRFLHRRFTARYLGDPAMTTPLVPDRAVLHDFSF